MAIVVSQEPPNPCKPSPNPCNPSPAPCKTLPDRPVPRALAPPPLLEPPVASICPPPAPLEGARHQFSIWIICVITGGGNDLTGAIPAVRGFGRVEGEGKGVWDSTVGRIRDYKIVIKAAPWCTVFNYIMRSYVTLERYVKW